MEQVFDVKLDPRVKAGSADLAAHDAAVRRMVGMMIDMDRALYRAGRAADSAGRIPPAVAAARDKIQPPPERPENLNLRQKLTWLLRQVRLYTGRPTRPQSELIETLDRQLREVLAELDAALKTEAGK